MINDCIKQDYDLLNTIVNLTYKILYVTLGTVLISIIDSIVQFLFSITIVYHTFSCLLV